MPPRETESETGNCQRVQYSTVARAVPLWQLDGVRLHCLAVRTPRAAMVKPDFRESLSAIVAMQLLQGE